MRIKNKSILQVFITCTLLFAAMFSQQATAQKKSSVMKIGTYDSRIVIFAWSRSDEFKKHMVKLNRQTDSAQKAHDTARVKELSIGAMSYQHLLHQMIFSNGSIAIVMGVVKDKLPELAKSAGVSVIVSKWEVTFSDPSVVIVDLTNQVAQLFQPKENIDKMAADISKEQPVPLDELGIESEMLDLYCQRFGKK